MDETPLYHRIAEAIRQDILNGNLKPGDRLPTIRNMTAKWNCTQGTIQRAYQELSRQGLITSRVGQGTNVIAGITTNKPAPLRRAALINRAEAFILEVLTAGYSPPEVEIAIRLAWDRWRVLEQSSSPIPQQILRFSGSHDLAMTWLAAHFPEINPGSNLQLTFSGSLGGLIALSEGQADIAGSHLWDSDSQTYNIPYIRRLFPGQQVVSINLAYRRLGWILPPGNPMQFQDFSQLVHPNINLINRQTGSGTRVWLDAQIRNRGLDPSRIRGYTNVVSTHTGVARAIAEGQANVGFGLEASARLYGLDFISLVREPYDLIILPHVFNSHPIQSLLSWLSSPGARQVIASLRGYEVEKTGQVEWIG